MIMYLDSNGSPNPTHLFYEFTV